MHLHYQQSSLVEMKVFWIVSVAIFMQIYSVYAGTDTLPLQLLDETKNETVVANVTVDGTTEQAAISSSVNPISITTTKPSDASEETTQTTKSISTTTAHNSGIMNKLLELNNRSAETEVCN